METNSPNSPAPDSSVPDNPVNAPAPVSASSDPDFLRDEDAVPGSRVVLGLGVFVVAFPLLCKKAYDYATYVGSVEPTAARLSYKAARDPLAWAFIVVVIIACIALTRLLPTRKNRKQL